MCMARTFCRSLQDERVKRGVDVASDHHLLVSPLKLKLKKSWAGAGQGGQPTLQHCYTERHLEAMTSRSPSPTSSRS
ncbi:hypothetical protein DPMN_041192 [Dreissena polymorpha]|uniref:Uncharacterized protein n=1 Tax=Dreissena polymorpha TaxID=45954 RepID=A0A9D4CWD5_DREPO|nr:hypothetical protein DPMN_041192 [Dreissena polymorpha]